MSSFADLDNVESLYRLVARHPGIPAGLRPELIKRAERCVGRAADSERSPSFFIPRGLVEGCKGAISRQA